MGTIIKTNYARCIGQLLKAAETALHEQGEELTAAAKNNSIRSGRYLLTNVVSRIDLDHCDNAEAIRELAAICEQDYHPLTPVEQTTAWMGYYQWR